MIQLDVACVTRPIIDEARDNSFFLLFPHHIMCVHNETGLFTMHVGRVLVGRKKRGCIRVWWVWYGTGLIIFPTLFLYTLVWRGTTVVHAVSVRGVGWLGGGVKIKDDNNRVDRC
jgi:hypothetical protein